MIVDPYVEIEQAACSCTSWPAIIDRGADGRREAALAKLVCT
jgi:hypothetical protein